MVTASIPQKPKVDISEVYRLIDAGHSQGAIGRQLNCTQSYISRLLKARRLKGAPSDEHTSGADDTALHSADDSAVMVTVPDNRDISPTTVQGYALDSAETWADHETRLQVLESFVKALQEHAQQPPVQHITVQPSYALHSAESVQTWDDPEDGKPERWNLWIPRGLKRRIEAQAKAAGIAPSSLVQRLLMAAINGQAVPDA